MKTTVALFHQSICSLLPNGLIRKAANVVLQEIDVFFKIVSRKADSFFSDDLYLIRNYIPISTTFVLALPMIGVQLNKYATQARVIRA